MSAVTFDEKLAIELFAEVAKEHGLEKSTQIFDIVMTMVNAVKDKHGETEYVLPAIEFLNRMVERIRTEHGQTGANT